MHYGNPQMPTLLSSKGPDGDAVSVRVWDGVPLAVPVSVGDAEEVELALLVAVALEVGDPRHQPDSKADLSQPLHPSREGPPSDSKARAPSQAKA